MNWKSVGFGVAGFCLSLGNAMYALPKGEEIYLMDIFVAVPAVCFLVAFGNAIIGAMGIKKQNKE